MEISPVVFLLPFSEGSGSRGRLVHILYLEMNAINMENSCITLSALAKGVPASSNADPKLEFALARGGCTFGRSLLVREFEGLEEGRQEETVSVFLIFTIQTNSQLSCAKKIFKSISASQLWNLSFLCQDGSHSSHF